MKDNITFILGVAFLLFIALLFLAMIGGGLYVAGVIVLAIAHNVQPYLTYNTFWVAINSLLKVCVGFFIVGFWGWILVVFPYDVASGLIKNNPDRAYSKIQKLTYLFWIFVISFILAYVFKDSILNRTNDLDTFFVLFFAVFFSLSGAVVYAYYAKRPVCNEKRCEERIGIRIRYEALCEFEKRKADSLEKQNPTSNHQS